MRRPFRWDKKYLYWGITAFLVISGAIVFFMALKYLPTLGSGLKKLGKILSPFIWGFVISYILKGVMLALEKNAFLPLTKRLYAKNTRHTGKGLARGLSVFVSEIIMLAVIAALVYMILPQLYQSIETIILTSPQYISNAIDWITRVLNGHPELEALVVNKLGDINSTIVSWLQSTALPKLGNIITNVTSGIYLVLSGIYNLVIGMIVSVYILSNLETFRANSKRLLYSVFSVERSKKILDGIAFTDRTFIGFINGKLLDSAIIGLICYIVCAILKMPYTLLVSVIVGVTNIIPFFGPFIGGIPSSLIILLVDPFKGLIFIVFVIILQQLDGNVIGPKILGTTVGINGFWVMFSIILGAGLFGFWGMLLGVPVFVVINSIINSRMENRLKENQLPTDTESYMDLRYIDPLTREAVRTVIPPAEESAAEERKENH